VLEDANRGIPAQAGSGPDDRLADSSSSRPGETTMSSPRSMILPSAIRWQAIARLPIEPSATRRRISDAGR
jgi:hypothetical protein